MSTSKLWNSLKTTAAAVFAITTISNPDYALSEACFGYRSWDNLEGDPARFTWQQRSSIAVADTDQNGYVGWIEASVDLKDRFFPR